MDNKTIEGLIAERQVKLRETIRRVTINADYTTLDINQFDDYPDLIDDICDPFNLQSNSFDGLVCLSVIEHVYDPQAAVNTLYRILKPGAWAFVHVPFVFRYHAPKDLYFQDYFRFTRDGVAWLFRDFEQLTLYPVRGRLSSALNLQRYWKKKIEKRFGHRANRMVDRIYDRFAHRSPVELQTSGYFIWSVTACSTITDAPVSVGPATGWISMLPASGSRAGAGNCELSMP